MHILFYDSEDRPIIIKKSAIRLVEVRDKNKCTIRTTDKFRPRIDCDMSVRELFEYVLTKKWSE